MEAGKNTAIIAYDGSAAARQAVVATTKLLGSCNALVVTVWEAGLAYLTPTAPGQDMVMTPPVDPGLAREVDVAVHEQAEKLAREGADLAHSLGLDAEPLSVPDDGGIARTIIDLARDRSAAAIIVGSRGLSGLRARLEGSTSKGLLTHAPCPVLVVHEPE
jgi:nucleotide-binding universal stress UspA family protein